MKLPSNPFDIIRTEDFNTDYNIIAKYFSEPKSSYYTNLIRRGNVILFGTRGSGKTMLLKSLYLPVYIEILKKRGKDPLTYPFDFIGILINCERYEFKIFRENIFSYHLKESEERVKHFWKLCMSHYFALLIVEEMLNTVIDYGEKIGLDFTNSLYNELFMQICKICKIDLTTLSSSVSFRSLGSLLKDQRKSFWQSMQQSVLDLDYKRITGQFDLSVVIEVGSVLKRIPPFKDVRFYILLDDFFYPNLADEQQKILLELIRVRNEPLAFKIATLPGGMVFKDDSGFELMPRGDEFTIESMERADIGRGSDYYHLVKDIVNNRLKDYKLSAEQLFAKGGDSTKDFLAKLKGEVKKGHIRPEYAGFDTLVQMSSGVIRTFLLLANKILDEQLKRESKKRLVSDILPIPVDIQTEIVNTESSLFLDAIESRESGFRQIGLVQFFGNESRQRLLNNQIANVHVQFQIKNYEKLKPEAYEILTKAITNNIFHSYKSSHRTTRRGIISIKSLVLNKLLTPVLRIPYQDRWTIDIEAEKINEILCKGIPISTSYHKPEKTLFSLYCTIISGDCTRINPNEEGKGCFYASPIRTDWTVFARDFFKKQFSKFEVAIEVPPKGDLTCKICEMIHKHKFGIYELTDLNKNVVFELALALSRGKHSFFIVNTEYPVEQIEALLGKEYIPYNVVEKEIKKMCEEKIIPIIKSKDPSWNEKIIRDLKVQKEKKTILLAMPRESNYYDKTLTKGTEDILKNEFNFDVLIPADYSEGNWFVNLLKDIKRATYCFIDTTCLPEQDKFEGRFLPKYLDYLQRVFILGLATGVRKVILHGYNSLYTQKIFTDMQGHCHFEYQDSTLFDELKKRIPEVFHE